MYLRFVLTEVDEDSTRKKGILVAGHELRDERELSREDHARLVQLLEWFNAHLEIPRVLQEGEHERALSWFKAEAAEPIAKTWELVHLLRAHGVLVELLKTADPGHVLYEDDWQLVATPRRGKRGPW